ncbi:DUF2332 domain-containing protein [uncultured Sphingomonas sp.]|uniref:DUF2332 domain-containing protein n=1 Tax=uncultured Sphingomonas sp. TaxID=158754 RepID=UPI0025E880EF|nr:DUF2332 domain-containing protein [uncultured Sphingomonas sp.]
MASEAENRKSFAIQAGYCAAMDAPITARICTALGQGITRASETGRRVLDWPGEPVADALVLRLVGGLHALHRRGVPELRRIFTGEETDLGRTGAALDAVLSAYDLPLMPWLYGPPQTNEPARSSGLMTGILHLARRFGPRFELLEIGSSGGLNLMIGRYGFDLGGVAAGPAASALMLRPAWRGVAPPDAPVEIVSARGVDIAPLDLHDDRDADRLQAYCWVDAVERQARLGTAIAMLRADPVRLERGDAAEWLVTRLAEPQPAGVARVLMHSVVWQYLRPAAQAQIAAAMEAAGAAATVDRPLGWVMMEPNRDLAAHEVRVRGWPGDTPMEIVARTHAHGAWVEGLSPPFATDPYVMRAPDG